MVRPPYFDSNGMKKGAWSEEEDNKLRAYVMRYGHETTWRLLPKYAGLARSGKSCRLRWVNYLKPGLKRGKFTKLEEDLIIKLHAQLGNKWSAIAAKFPGRTDNEIKNYWNAHINKRGKQIPAIEKVIRFTSEASSKDQMMKEEKASAFTLCKTTQNESTSLDANSLIKRQQTTLSFDNNSSFLPVTQPDQVEIQPDIFLADLPPLLEEEFFYPQLHYSELSSGDSSYNMSALDWIANDDHRIIASEYVAQPVEGSYLTESFALSTWNSQNESSYDPTPQEVGGLYDALFESSHNMSALDCIANDDHSIMASEYVAQPVEGSYLTESFALSTWNSQNESSYNPTPQEVGGLYDALFESSHNMSALDCIANDDHSIMASEYVAQPVEGSYLTESFALSAWNSQNGSSYNPPPQEVGGLCDPLFESSYNMSALDWIANDDHSIIASEYVAQLVEGSYLTESFELSTWNSQNGSSYNPPPQEVGGLCDALFESSYNMSAFDWIANDDHSIIASEYVAQPVEGSYLTESFALSTWNSQNGSYNPPPQEVGGLYDALFESSHNMSALDCIANDDHSVMASEYVAQPVEGRYLTESFALSAWNSQNGSSYNPPPQEVGGLCDPLFESSYNMSAFDWIANDDHSIIASEYVAQPVEGSYLTESFALSTWNSQNGSYNPPPQEVGGLYDPFFEYFDYGVNLFS